jgi:hypothetical protein
VNAGTLASRKESFKRCTVTGRQETTAQKSKSRLGVNVPCWHFSDMVGLADDVCLRGVKRTLR